jgi:hypothetical protein
MRNAFVATLLLLLPACGSENRQVRSDAPGLMAMARGTTDVPAGRAQPGPRPVSMFSDQTLRDPVERFQLIERLRVQVVSRTRGVSAARWQGQLRPSLRRQLTAAGLAPADADFLLWEIDQAKGSSGG